MSIDSYWNEEDDSEIICPYCREKYTPTYEETIYLSGWKYRTETIDGEMTEQEHEEEWE